MNYEIYVQVLIFIVQSQLFETPNSLNKYSCFKFSWIASVRFLPPIFGAKLCFPLRLKTTIGIPL